MNNVDKIAQKHNLPTNSLNKFDDLEVDQFKATTVLQSLNLSNLNYEIDMQEDKSDKINSENELKSDLSVEELIIEHKKQIERINNN